MPTMEKVALFSLLLNCVLLAPGRMTRHEAKVVSDASSPLRDTIFLFPTILVFPIWICTLLLMLNFTLYPTLK
jgi:hypothetical protein